MIHTYLEAYTDKIEHDIQQRLASFRLSSSSCTLNELSNSKDSSAGVGGTGAQQKKLDINEIDKRIEELERTLLASPLTPQDILCFREKAKEKFKVDRSLLFDTLLETNKPRLILSQQSQHTLQANRKKDYIRSAFSWITSKISRRPLRQEGEEEEVDVARGVHKENTQTPAEEEEQRESEQKQEFRDLVEHYLEETEFNKEQEAGGTGAAGLEEEDIDFIVS